LDKGKGKGDGISLMGVTNKREPLLTSVERNQRGKKVSSGAKKNEGEVTSLVGKKKKNRHFVKGKKSVSKFSKNSDEGGIKHGVEGGGKIIANRGVLVHALMGKNLMGGPERAKKKESLKNRVPPTEGQEQVIARPKGTKKGKQCGKTPERRRRKNHDGAMENAIGKKPVWELILR